MVNGECNLASTIVIWIECNFLLNFDRARRNTSVAFIVQIGKIEKKYGQQNLELANPSNWPLGFPFCFPFAFDVVIWDCLFFQVR